MQKSPYKASFWAICRLASFPVILYKPPTSRGLGRGLTMARTNRLTAVKVARINKPGRHADGGGLILQCATGADGSPRKSWIFRYEVGGRERWMGLGAYPDVSVAEARGKAADARRLRDQGVAPLRNGSVRARRRRSAPPNP